MDCFAATTLQPPASIAITAEQKHSIAELPKQKKYALYEVITLDDRRNYYAISCRPITKKAEDDMELISDIITWGEEYRHHFEEGIYKCSKCDQALYSSKDKWNGPCVWPSFRSAYSDKAITSVQVYPYNNYAVEVREVYCSGCDLFIGHQFEDGIVKGDSHPEAKWRH